MSTGGMIQAVEPYLRHYVAEIGRKAYGHGCNASGLYDQKKSPAVKKSPQRREGFAQVDVDAACLRHHRGKLAVRESAHYRQKPRDYPDDQEPAGRADLIGNVRRDQKDAGPDHRSGDNHSRVPQSKPANKTSLLVFTLDGLLRHAAPSELQSDNLLMLVDVKRRDYQPGRRQKARGG